MSIVGLDLGTTFSAVAYLNEMGLPQIVPNMAGERIMPSALFFEQDRVLVGKVAINSRQADATRSVRWIKREMGNKNYRFRFGGEEYSPSKLSSYIVKKLLEDAETTVGSKPDVLITVPANFEDEARRATIEAGELAGFRVIGLVNEPTAAAYYYAVTKHITGRSLVFDLGGGTFDISIADISPDYAVKIITSKGDRSLGGYNIDQRLVDYLEEEYHRQKGGTLLETSEDKAVLEDYAEEIKIQLSVRDSVSYMVTGSNGRMKGELTLEKFNSLITIEMSRIQLLLDNVLKESNDTPSTIKNVLLVGGSTRLRAVQEYLASKFGKGPEVLGNVDEVVALGAALYAGKRMIEDHPEDVSPAMKPILTKAPVLLDVCNHSYGTLSLSFSEKMQKKELVNSIIIPKNTSIPCTRIDDFYTVADNQASVLARVTQGEGEDPDNVTLIAEQEMELPPNTPKGSIVRVTYSYDKDQRMNCVFEHVDSGKTVKMNLDLNSAPKK